MSKPLIELVVHSYAEQHPEFAKLLTCQLSSLILWPPQECAVNVVVCWTVSDSLTFSVLNGFESLFADSGVPAKLQPLALTKERLFRRGCGRNVAAKRTLADCVFFIDADYILGDGCLDTLAAQWRAGFPAKLVFPREVHITRSHALGDKEIAKVVPGEIFMPDLSLYEIRQEKMAIGGLQIVSGDTAREFGYCAGTKWSEPVSEAGGFRNTHEDKVYRKLLGGSKPIDLPNCFRQRHSASAFQSAEERLAQTEGKA